MPEGPEIRRFADALNQALGGKPIVSLLARTMAQRAYTTGGFTVSDEARTRLINDSSLVYTPGSEYGTRHYVFRRTNLPCLVCGSTIRQLRQVTQSDEEGEKTRIIYFCPNCQGTNVELKKSKSKRKVVATGDTIIEVQA
jgi:formamidopyrimidine-DNA glycosylase